MPPLRDRHSFSGARIFLIVQHSPGNGVIDYLPSKNPWKWRKKMYVSSRLGLKCISFWWSEVFLHNRKVFPLMETEVSGNSLPNLFLCNKGYLQPFHTLLHYDPRLCEKSTQPAGALVGLVMDWDGFGHSDTTRRKVLIFLTQFEWIYALHSSSSLNYFKTKILLDSLKGRAISPNW